MVDSEKMLEKGKLIEIRPHTRFVHFPRHRHNYVEVLYMCSGSTTHILNGTQRMVLHTGDLLFLNQAVYHEILPAAEEDVGVNFIILPQFFDRSFRMLEQENVLRDFLVSTLQYIETSYRNGTLEEIAARLHMPAYALSRLLKHHIGANFKQLLQQRKLQQAAYLLTNTSMPVNAILEFIGYENSSYFHNKF